MSKLSTITVCWLHEKRGAFGGAEANVVETALALKQHGFNNVLVYRERTGVDEERWDQAFDDSIAVNNDTDWVPMLKKFNAAIVWIHNWSSSADFESLTKLRIPRARMIHDHAMYCMRHYKYHPLTRRNCTRPASPACIFPCLATIQRGQGRWPIKIASFSAKLKEISHNRGLDHLVVNSQFMAGELQKNGFAKGQIHVLPPLPPERDLPEDILLTPPRSGHLLFAGQVIRGKGLDLLLKSLKGITMDWTLTVAGKGSALSKCQHLAEQLAIAKRINWLGHLSPLELARLYRSAAIVVVPSVWQEPFGMIGIEAMRHARPVIAFASGGIPEWMQDNVHGRLVPTGDIPALRKAIESLLSDPQTTEKYGLQASHWAHNNFSFNGYIERLKSFLKNKAVE
jgi:glycosyltransferase involved in cell wall biosynthesis